MYNWSIQTYSNKNPVVYRPTHLVNLTEDFHTPSSRNSHLDAGSKHLVPNPSLQSNNNHIISRHFIIYSWTGNRLWWDKRRLNNLTLTSRSPANQTLRISVTAVCKAKFPSENVNKISHYGNLICKSKFLMLPLLYYRRTKLRGYNNTITVIL